MANHDFAPEYKAFWQSALGRDLLQSLKQLHDSKIDDSERSDSMEKGYGLLKEASGVMLSMTLLQSKGTTVVSKARRNREE